MRLPLKVSSAIRARKLIPPGARVLVALSGGPDSVALLLCLSELARKRDLGFRLVAAHLNHGLRGTCARRDLDFCRALCVKRSVKLIEGYCETKKLAAFLKRSHEESARLVRRCFLSLTARAQACTHVAVAHHADDRIETVLYRLSRGTGLAGLEGIGWNGPLTLAGEPDVSEWLVELRAGKPVQSPHPPVLRAAHDATQETGVVVRPLLGCRREEVLAYLRSHRQRYCTDETNFDTRIPRNAIRGMVLPVLERKVHPGVRAALWRLAEEASVHAQRRAWRHGWLDGIAAMGTRGFLALPVSRPGPPPGLDELAEVLSLLKARWGVRDLAGNSRHLQALRGLFGVSSAQRYVLLAGKVVAERRGQEVWMRRK